MRIRYEEHDGIRELHAYFTPEESGTARGWKASYACDVEHVPQCFDDALAFGIEELMRAIGKMRSRDCRFDEESIRHAAVKSFSAEPIVTQPSVEVAYS